MSTHNLDGPLGDSSATSKTGSTSPKGNASNPFSNGSFPTQASTEIPISAHFPYISTNVPQQTLRSLPYKTSNRIFDDMRYTPAFVTLKESNEYSGSLASLLSARPIEYKTLMATKLATARWKCLVLNNAISQVPAVCKTWHGDNQVVVHTVRGLIVDQDRTHINHFKIQILNASPTGHSSSVDKLQFHVIDRTMVSVDDLNLLEDVATAAGALLDDVFFKSLSSQTNLLLRVSVYGAEFSREDLHPLVDQNEIKARYLQGIENNPATSLSPEVIPNPVHCFQTLLKVLKGPILLPASEAIHTISKSKTSLDAKIDIDLLFQKLSFTIADDNDNLVPPNLSVNKGLRESYIRKSYELIFLGKYLKTHKVNDFDVNYSFSDNLSQVHTILAEVDKHSTLTMSGADSSNRNPDYVSLSAYAFFQDELIIRCYEHTVNSDPSNKLSYVDSFKSIMSHRSYSNTSRLHSYYNIQHSKGHMYGFSDYRDTLRALGIDGIPNDASADEDVVIEMYKASCKGDPKNYTYFNKQLRIICAIKDSPKIRDFLRTELIPSSTALEELRIENITEDEVVVTAYEFRLDEVMQSVNFNVSSPEINFLQRCLLSVAIERKSYILMAYIEKHIPELSRPPQEISVEEAMQILDVDAASSDFDIISKFQEKVTQLSYDEVIDIRTIRYALEITASVKGSKILMSFLKNGKIDESLLPPENWPTGLDNIGNTCYLNSLLQYYFSIKPLRDAILNFDEKDVDINKLKSRKIGGRVVEESEIYRSFQFIYRLQELFIEMISTPKRFISPSKELAYLSFLPLSQTVNFQEDDNDKDVEMLSSDNVDVKSVNSMEVAPSLSEVSSCTEPMNSELDLIEVDDMTPESDTNMEVSPAVNKDEVRDQHQTKILSIGSEQIESAIETGRQQDVTECIENVTFQIETALEPEHLDDGDEHYDLIRRLFSGKTKQTITPLESDRPPRVSFERFFSLIINVGDHPKDIYDALDNYFGENMVGLDEGKVKMSATISETPEILQFHVQRVLFDRERLMAYKSIEVIPFGESIYLDRYLTSEDPEILAKRQEVFEWKTEMNKLEDEKRAITDVDPDTKLSVVDTLSATVKYLKTKVLDNDKLAIQQETITAIENQVQILKNRLEQIKIQSDILQEKISNQFTGYKKFGFSLFAIFIHRGEASYGHYWVYIKDPHKNIYRKYNDDTVTEVPFSEVFNFTETNTATPYYMVYVKEELMEEYIEPLKRVIKC